MSKCNINSSLYSQQEKSTVLSSIFSFSKNRVQTVLNKALEEQQLSFIPTSLRNYLLNDLKIKTQYPIFEIIYDYTKKGKETIRIAQSTLAKLINQSIPTVKRHIKKLMQLGIIKIKRVFDAKLKNYVNEYDFTLNDDIIAIIEKGNMRTLNRQYDCAVNEIEELCDSHVEMFKSQLRGINLDPLNSSLYNNINATEILEKNVCSESKKTTIFNKIKEKGREVMEAFRNDDPNDERICRKIELDLKELLKYDKTIPKIENDMDEIKRKIELLAEKEKELMQTYRVAEENFIAAAKLDKPAYYKIFSKAFAELTSVRVNKENLERSLDDNMILPDKKVSNRKITYDHIKYVYKNLKFSKLNIENIIETTKQILYSFYDRSLDGDLKNEEQILNKGIFSAKKQTWTKPLSYPSKQ